MAIGTFVALANQYDAALTTGVNTVIANGITNNATMLGAALTLYVVIYGYLMTVGKVQWATFVAAGLRAGLISALMTAATYSTYVATPAMNTIPTWIAQSTNGVASINSGPQQFDLLMSAVNHQEAAILQQATGWDNIGYRLEAAAYAGGIAFLLVIGFFVYEFSRMIMGVLVATLPFLLFFALFEATRGIPLRLANYGAGILILQLMLSIMLQIMMTADSFFMQTVFAAGGQGLDEQIVAMRDISVFFLFGIGMVSVLPAIAAHIGGGIANNVGGTLIRVATNALRGRPR